MSMLLKVDFHSHTLYSGDGVSSPAEIIAALHEGNLDRLVVTDHNTIQGALLAKALDPEHIIVGEEIKTTKGELLAVFVCAEIPPFLPPFQAIELLRQQGAFISVSHPFDLHREGWKMADLMEITPLVDAIEVFNAHCFSHQSNEQAQRYAKENRLAGTAGSDAHMADEIGLAYVQLPEFGNADELRKVIQHGSVVGNYTSALVRIATMYTRLVKRKSKS